MATPLTTPSMILVSKKYESQFDSAAPGATMTFWYSSSTYQPRLRTVGSTEDSRTRPLITT